MYELQEADPKKVRPIQLGEFLRNYVSRRLLALSEGEIAALTTSMRQIGVGTQWAAEALAIFTQRTAGQNLSRREKWFEND